MFNRKGVAASAEEVEDDAARCETIVSSQSNSIDTSHRLRSTIGSPPSSSRMTDVLSYLRSVNRAIPDSSERARRAQA
jgi:hypothetical protein